MSPDIQAALNAAIIRSQAQQAPAPRPHQLIPQAQSLAQALARAMANGRLPLGKAHVNVSRTDQGGMMRNNYYAPQGNGPIDGGYSGAGIFQNGQLVARRGFGPHPVPPQMLAPGMQPLPGVGYVQ